MSDTFDPYYKWLGIPPADQPANHYRLLGIPLFTSDPDVIENAADQRMSHVRSFQAGKHSAESQQILNEIAKAKVCLLTPAQKAAYDQQLTPQQTQPAASITPLSATPLPVSQPRPMPVAKRLTEPEPVAQVQPTFISNTPSVTAGTKPRKKPKSPAVELAKIVVGGIAGLALGYLLLSYIAPGSDIMNLGGDSNRNPRQAKLVKNDPANTVDSAPPATIPPTPVPSTNNPPTVSSPANVTPPPDSPLGKSGGSTPVLPTVPQAEPALVDTPEVSPVNPAPAPANQPAEKLAAELDLAMEQFEVRKAVALAGELARLQQADELEAQADALLRLGEAAQQPAQTKQVAEGLLELVGSAIAEGRREFAQKYQDSLVKAARDSGDSRLIGQATLSVIKIQQLQ